MFHLCTVWKHDFLRIYNFFSVRISQTVRAPDKINFNVIPPRGGFGQLVFLINTYDNDNEYEEERHSLCHTGRW